MCSINTVVVIEHNLDVIKTADYIIDMGPEGGEGGGKVIATGTPEEVAQVKGSYTGQYLKKYLNQPTTKSKTVDSNTENKKSKASADTKKIIKK